MFKDFIVKLQGVKTSLERNVAQYLLFNDGCSQQQPDVEQSIVSYSEPDISLEEIGITANILQGHIHTDILLQIANYLEPRDLLVLFSISKYARVFWRRSYEKLPPPYKELSLYKSLSSTVHSSNELIYVLGYKNNFFAQAIRQQHKAEIEKRYHSLEEKNCNLVLFEFDHTKPAADILTESKAIDKELLELSQYHQQTFGCKLTPR